MAFFHTGALYKRRGSIPPVYIVFSAAWFQNQVQLYQLGNCKYKYQFGSFFSHAVYVFSECEFIVECYTQLFQIVHLRNWFVIQVYFKFFSFFSISFCHKHYF